MQFPCIFDVISAPIVGDKLPIIDACITVFYRANLFSDRPVDVQIPVGKATTISVKRNRVISQLFDLQHIFSFQSSSFICVFPLNHTLTETDVQFGCVNLYASIQRGMSDSANAGL